MQQFAMVDVFTAVKIAVEFFIQPIKDRQTRVA
jgi:hypothetical protein